MHTIYKIGDLVRTVSMNSYEKRQISHQYDVSLDFFAQPRLGIIVSCDDGVLPWYTIAFGDILIELGDLNIHPVKKV